MIGDLEQYRGEGGVHSMNYLWNEHQEDVGCRLPMVYTINDPNKTNRTEILCHVWSMWPAISRFIFNTKWHWKLLVIQVSKLIVHRK